MKNSLFFLLIILAEVGNSQYSISGKIIDKETSEPLAFVTIILSTGEYGSTNINGTFKLESKKKITTIECKYLGYRTKVVQITSSNVIIKLEPKDFQLKEFKVIAGENPAHQIIRKVIKNKKENNPQNLSSYQYLSYNKTKMLVDSAKNIEDSVKIDNDSYSSIIPMFIIESVSKKTFVSPDIEEEIVIANRVSGFNNPSFSSVVTQLQPFAFYKNTITILDKNYLNPISKGSIKRYFFLIEDSLFNKTDTTYILSFRPRKGKNFDGLKGVLYINSNNYAIQNVIAEPFEKAFITMKIQQKYSFVNNTQWFPEQLNYQLIIKNYPTTGFGTQINGEAFLDSVLIEPKIRRRDVSAVAFRIDEDANEKDSVYWENQRKVPLSEREINSFRVIDSLGEEFDFDGKFTIFEKLMSGKIPVKFVDIDLSKSLVSNDYEGFRLGLGLNTNDKIADWFSVGGFFGYGLRDKEWKYGGDLTFFLSKEHEVELKGAHKNTVLETANTALNQFAASTFQVNTFIGFQKDRVISNNVSLSFRSFRYAKFNFSFTNTQFSPRYQYSYKGEDLSQKLLTTSEVGLFMRYSFKERLAENFNQRISLGTTYPVLSVAYTRGLNDVFNSQFDYNKVEARVEASHFFKNLGKSSLRIQGGWIDKPLPYSLQFTGFGIKTGDFSVYFNNYFQTVTPYEFAMDKYAIAHFTHNFGSLLFKSEKFKPQFSIHQHIGYGSLSNIKDHGVLELKTMEKGFFESGLQIDNLYRINYFNIAYLGLGAGVNYRYGGYYLPELKDNFAFNISFIFTTN